MTVREAFADLIRTGLGTFPPAPWSLLPSDGPCVGGHDFLDFEGGSGCSRCEAWISNPREEHTVELTPATRIDLTEAIAQLRASVAADIEPPATVAVPLLPHPQAQLAGMTGPVALQEPSDRILEIIAEILPVVREGVSLSTLLVVAHRIEAAR